MAILTPVRETVPFEDLKNTVLSEQSSGNVSDNTVLSFSFRKGLLPPRQAALRDAGYKVFSTTSEACVRFEIQMGQCGVLLLCYTVPEPIQHELVRLFKRSCEDGVIAYVMHPVELKESRHAHLCFLDLDFSQKLHLIKGLQTTNRTSV